MPKRRSVGQGVGRKANKRPRRHLYVVLDDGEGYAIRKFDLSSDHRDSSDDDDDQLLEQRTTVVQRLPPPLIGLDSTTGEYFTAIGTKIMVTHNSWPGLAVPVFDVRTRRLDLGPPPRASSSRTLRCPAYLPLGDKLVSLDAGSAEMLGPPPPRCSIGYSEEWSWRKLPRPPFRCMAVRSYAAHPDGRTVFFSTDIDKNSMFSSSVPATFALDITGSGEPWRRLGEWRLPFSRRAHFDPELDAWVGLAGGNKDNLGYLCSTDVPQPSSSTDDQPAPPPDWKLSKEKMFCHDPAEEHAGATLAYMGSRSRFCLVHCFSVADEEYADMDVEAEEDRPRRHLLRLTSFSLKYDKHGNLQVSTQRRVRCYNLPNVIQPVGYDLRAFWM